MNSQRKSSTMVRRSFLSAAAAFCAAGWARGADLPAYADASKPAGSEGLKRHYTAKDVTRVIQEVAPLDQGVPNDQQGFLFGDPEQTVKGVGCVWIADAAAIRACTAQGLDLIICHEDPWLPAQESDWYTGPSASEIYSNRLRRELLDKGRMVVFRIHSAWDAQPLDGVADQAVAVLKIAGARTVARQKYFSVQELPKPVTVKALKKWVERGLQFSDCRIFGNPQQQVSRFAFLIGGFGSNQVHMPQAARDMGAEAIVIGEMNEGIVVSALEMGMPVIETLHSISETPGVARQAEVLSKILPGLPVRHVHSGASAFGGEGPT